MVERDLAKVEVASSNLVSRSNISKDQKVKGRIYFFLLPFYFCLEIRRRSQVVRQSSAKALFISSILIAASNIQT